VCVHVGHRWSVGASNGHKSATHACHQPTTERRPDRASAMPSCCFCFSFTLVTWRKGKYCRVQDKGGIKIQRGQRGLLPSSLA
jgi:hypothetical protein